MVAEAEMYLQHYSNLYVINNQRRCVT